MSGSLDPYMHVRFAAVLACALLCVGRLIAADASPAQQTSQTRLPAAGCRVTGTVNAGSIPLPGVAIVVRVGEAVKVATSTDTDGKFAILFGPDTTYRVSVEMMAFAPVEQELSLGALPCDTTLNFQLNLRQRTEATARGSSSSTPDGGQLPQAQRAAGRGRGAAPTAGGPQFERLNVQADANIQALADEASADLAADLARLLPAGFTVQSAQADAVTISGTSDAINIDRGVLNDRLNAIGRGDFDPATGQFAQGLGPAGGGLDGVGAQIESGGRGFGPGGRGGGPGGFALGGRGGRGQSAYQGSANYTFGGSAIDATNLQPRNGVVTPVSSLPFARNNFGATVGGPLKIPGLYANTNRRTNFQLNYSGNHSTQLQDQYATVPTAAMRAGDFSASAIQLVDPATGLPFPDNQIPANLIDSTAAALMSYIPLPNVPGAVLTQNYHNASTTLSTSNAVSVRITQNLSPSVPQPGGPGGRGGGGRGAGGGGGRLGGPGGPGGPNGRGGRGLTVMLTGQLQYRRNKSDVFNVVPDLGGASENTTLAAPITLNVSKGRTTQTISFQVNHSRSATSNPFSNVTDVAGNAGVNYPGGAATDPLNWGVPNLTFSQFSMRSAAASERTDDRISLGYVFARPVLGNKHLLRFGGDFRRDVSKSQVNSDARGTFLFTGLYTSNGGQASSTNGSDFADFLLGRPQQASLQVGGETKLRQNTWSVYLEDNWQQSSRMTLNLGLRYELAMPYVEVNGRMANLDVTPMFTSAAVVTPGESGAYTGEFPAGLVNTDWGNIGPRIGIAYRLARNTVLRGGYSITYNSSSYATIARQLVGQPPWAETETNIGSIDDPLTIADGLVTATATTTNNFGVDKNYGLGLIQTWNATLSKDLPHNFTLIAGYTGTKGTSLDLLRAPNRNPDGTLRIPDVQSFIWESAGGHSILQLGNFQLRRRLTKGLGAGLSYTLAKSMDNASSLGAGTPVVAQNDQDLGAEWALSNFDQRHNLSADVHYELPFGTGRKWLANGGWLAALVGDWTADATFTAHSGSPFTARVVNATSSVASGTSGSLRADYSGDDVALSDPTLLDFFNTGAFAIPAGGFFGTASRNSIIGPGGYVTNAVFSRDMRVRDNQSVTLQVNANNLFNTIRWASIDTNINSRTFGYVTRFSPMRTVTLNLRYRF